MSVIQDQLKFIADVVDFRVEIPGYAGQWRLHSRIASRSEGYQRFKTSSVWEEPSIGDFKPQCCKERLKARL